MNAKSTLSSLCAKEETPVLIKDAQLVCAALLRANDGARLRCTWAH